MHQLTSDIDLLDQWPLRFLMPWLWALLLQTAFVLWLLWPRRLCCFMCCRLCCWPVWCCPRWRLGAAWRWRGKTQAAEERRRRLLMPLSLITSLLLWRRWADCETSFLEADADMAVPTIPPAAIGECVCVVAAMCAGAAGGFAFVAGVAAVGERGVGVCRCCWRWCWRCLV